MFPETWMNLANSVGVQQCLGMRRWSSWKQRSDCFGILKSEDQEIWNNFQESFREWHPASNLNHLAELKENNRWSQETYILTSFLLGEWPGLPATGCSHPSHSLQYNSSWRENQRPISTVQGLQCNKYSRNQQYLWGKFLDYPKRLLLMVSQGPYYVGTVCVLSAFPFLELILLQPGFTGCLARGKNWQVSSDSAICAFFPHQRENAFKINYFESTSSPFKFYFKTSQ